MYDRSKCILRSVLDPYVLYTVFLGAFAGVYALLDVGDGWIGLAACIFCLKQKILTENI